MFSPLSSFYKRIAQWSAPPVHREAPSIKSKLSIASSSVVLEFKDAMSNL